MGTEKSKGMTIYSLSGHVTNPGQFEAPLGITLRQLLDLAGGIREGTSSSSGPRAGRPRPMLTAEHLDVPLDYEGVASVKSMLGTKALQCFDETTSVVRTVLRWTEFYKHESCGKCTPCREGTWWLVQILKRMEAGQGEEGDIEKLLDLCENILGRSFCALGDGATSPITSAIQYFRDEFEAAMHTPAWELFPYERSTIFVREPAGASHEQRSPRASSALAAIGGAMTEHARPFGRATTTSASSAPRERDKREDLVTLTIDDVEVSVPKGTLVIRAAELIGVEIPRFCDHPLLDPVGACRQCLVEVPDAGNGRPIPKPQASCTLEVAPGMKIKTQLTSPVADKAQHGNMEFLLINHPLDCPICDKGGECPLQNQALSHGYAETRFTDVKRTYPKPINISANVLLDRERCVLCARCTRFSEQVAGDPFIALIERGALQQVGIYEKEPFQSYFSGNTIQICPVGALTSAAYRFRSRPFDLVSHPVGRRARRLRVGHPGRPPARHGDAPAGRRRPRGQRGVDHRQGPVRLRLRAGRRPADPAAGPRGQSRWTERAATGVLAGGDRRRRPRAAGRRPAPVAAAGVLTGGRLTLEDAYAYAKFARAVLGTNNIDFRARPHSDEEADFLVHAVAGTGLRA